MTKTCPEWKQRAEDFLMPYVDSDSETLHEEAVVYFLSRGDNCKGAINKIISKWKDRIETRGQLFRNLRFLSIFSISIWRLVEWAKIVHFKSYWEIPPKTYFLNRNDLILRTEKYNFQSPFFVFWSNLSIQLLEMRLKTVLLHFTDVIEQDFSPYKEFRQKYPGSDVLSNTEQCKYATAAYYLFGISRMQTMEPDKKVISLAQQLLIKNQASDGSWWMGSSDIIPQNVILTAMIIHALAISNTYGINSILEHAKNWLLSIQNPNGSWPSFKRHDLHVYSTVFVLDALELAEGRKQVTFTPDLVIPTTPKIKDMSIDKKSQTIIYKNRRVSIGGNGAPWKLFERLFEGHGNTVTFEEMRKATGYRDDENVNKAIHRLKNRLREKKLGEIANKIENTHSVGYFLKI